MSDIFKLSVSKTNTFEDCKAKYKYTYILKLPRKDRDFHILGRFTHRVLELFHLSLINDPTSPLAKEMGIAFKEAIKEYRASLSEASRKEAFDILNKYLYRLTLHKEELSGILALEKNFDVEVAPGIILNGMIDRIQKDQDGIFRVVDYKTTKNKKYLENEWFQLATYAYTLYLENPTIEKVRASYILLRHNGEYLTTEFSIPEILKIKDTYIEMATKMQTETEFEASPSRLCSWCDHFEICDIGKKFIQPNFKYGQTNW